jgi:cytochrome c-type biogenesis protein CcmH/NrfG
VEEDTSVGGHSRQSHWILAAVTVAAGLLGSAAIGTGLPNKPAAPPDPIQENNRGVALMEQFKHGEAMAAFRLVTAAAPAWAPGFANLGLAALYARQIEDAEAALRKAVRLDPELIQGHYGLALLEKNRGDSAAAIAALEQACSLDPEDGQILYNLGLLQARQRKFSDAIAFLRQAREIDPNSMSIRYQLARSLLQAGERAAGEAEMAEYQRLSSNENFSVPTGNQYGEAGPYALVITDYSALANQAPPGPQAEVRFVEVTADTGITFVHGGPGGEVDPAATGAQAAARHGSGVAVGDLDGDMLLDLVLANASVDGKAKPGVFRNRGNLRFEDVTAKSGLTFAGVGMAVALADYDNDDDLDLVFTGRSGVALYRNRGDGTFEDATAGAGLSVDGFSAGASWADVDHDGDVDLYVGRLPSGSGAAGSTARLLLNRGDGTFVDDTKRLGLAGPDSGSLGGVFADFDNDRDIDLALSTRDGSALLLDNRRDRGFVALGARAGLPVARASRGVTAGDVDGDGYADLVFSAGSGSPQRVFINGADGTFRQVELAGGRDLSAYGSALFDADNDGDLDLLFTGGALRYYRNDGTGRFEDRTAATGLAGVAMVDGRALAAADLDQDGDLDLIGTRNGGRPLLLRNDGGNTNRWLAVVARGLNSNKDGIGAKVEVQAGPAWQRREIQAGSGYLSQSAGTVHFGLGGRRLADFVRLIWPGGVLQSEMDIAAGQLVEKVELDRKGSSCPLLFAWNGIKHVFVTDFLGVGGLGLWLAPGVYGKPDPEEYIKIEPDQLAPRDGAYYFQVMENLEEITYLDEVKLIAIDHPKGIDVYPNESFGGVEQGPHRTYAVRREDRIFPIRATDNTGRHVVGRVLEIDRQYADNFRLHRLAGFAEQHHLSLEFPDEVEDQEGLVLFLYGWVDFEYSSSMFAAYQSGLTLELPVLEVQGDDGLYHPVLDSMGFPAGMPRMMTVDLATIGALQSRHLRIRTNMRAYWDQIFIARPMSAEQVSEQVVVNEIKLGAAHLHRRGYPREHSPDGRQPLVYDYGIMDNSQPFRTMTGNYTRFGRVTELLTRTDDKFAIFGKGEEITLEFPVKGIIDPPKGSIRSFLLYASGYCKDMDPHTAHGETVEPLPFRAMSNYPYPDDESYPDDPDRREYLDKYNTRRVDGR